MKFDSYMIIRKLNAPTDVMVDRVAINVAWVANHERIPPTSVPTSKTLIVAIGGDGTMLEAMRVAQPVSAYAIGINLGNVGFLTDVSHSDDMEALADDLLALFRNTDGQFFAERRMMLRASFGDRTDLIAGNEICISGTMSDSMIKYRLSFDGVDAGIHRANSILISTPTGSTAYSLSAGGALMMPSMHAIQVVPVAPLTLTSRPIIVSGDTVIGVEVWGKDIAVKRDGCPNIILNPATTTTTVVVQSTQETVRVIHDRRWNFFDVLTDKLGWVKG